MDGSLSTTFAALFLCKYIGGNVPTFNLTSQTPSNLTSLTVKMPDSVILVISVAHRKTSRFALVSCADTKCRG